MKISQDILSLYPDKVSKAVFGIYDKSATAENEAGRALMHRLVNYIVTANENKSQKKEPVLLEDLEAKIRANDDQYSEHISRAEAGVDAIGYAKLLAKELHQHVFTPALTAHPTNPKSLETDQLLVDIYDLFMLLRNEAAAERTPESEAEKTRTISEKLQNLAARKPDLKIPQNTEESEYKNSLQVAESYLEQCCAELSRSPLLPENKLTVAQEVERNLQIFGRFFGEHNKFKHRLINDFCERYKVEDAVQIAEITKILTPAIARQFQQIHFWSASDADGNVKITSETMLDAISRHQLFLDELYLGEIEKLKTQFADNKLVLVELDLIAAIVKQEQGAEAGGVVATAKDSTEIVRRIDNIIDSASPAQWKELVDLRDSFDCFGFVGPKMDVRQSSVRNVTAMQQILDFLRAEKVEGVAAFAEKYDSEEFDKKAFTQFLQTPASLDLLEKEGSLERITELAKTNFPDEATAKIAEQELRRMMVAKRYPDIVHRYIISDNKGVNSWNEVRAFEAIAFRIEHGADKEDQRPLQVYPLCETSEDIKNLPIMIDALLKNPEAVKQLKGRLDLFIGYSDAEKRSGTFALVLLQQKIFESLQIIEKFNETLPEGEKLRVEIFQGRGNDLIRGGGKKYSSATDQGQGAVDFSFKQELKAALLATAGRVDDFDLQMKQWQKLSEEQRQIVSKITENAVDEFEKLVSHQEGGKGHGDELAEFLKDVSINSALKETNQSSRAPAKGAASKQLNLDSERAIGLATRFSACGMPFNVLGLGQISHSDTLELSALCKDLTVVQDIVLKTTYALAISDVTRAQKIAEINNAAPEKTAKLFAEFENLSFQALDNVVKTLPLNDVRTGEILATISDERDKKTPANEVAKLVMAQLSSQFPLMKKLQDSVAAYEQNYKPVVHGILDEYKSADAEKRGDLDKQLAVIFREEMRIPREIDGLTTKTQFTAKENVIGNSQQAPRPLQQSQNQGPVV